MTRTLLVAIALSPSTAVAEVRGRVELEAGAEVDTNPHRVDEAAEGTPEPAGVARLGMRAEASARPTAGHALRVDLAAAVKKFTTNGEAQEEDVGVVSGEVRYDVRPGERPFLFGARASYYEAFEEDTIVLVESPSGAHYESADGDFRTGDAALVLSLLGAGDHRVVATGGLRFFQYKPDAHFDFQGELAGLAWTHAFPLGDPDADTPQTIDVTAQYAVQRRRYDSSSYANVCADYQHASDPQLCLIETPFARVDVFHAGAIEALYSGSRLFGFRYELHVNDSSSFGESLVRHRFEVSATSELFADVFLTARVLLQLNQFLDPALREGDTGTFITIEDESRNALFLHLARELGASWTVEARYAFYANAFSEADVPYRRHTVYAGLIYGFQSRP